MYFTSRSHFSWTSALAKPNSCSCTLFKPKRRITLLVTAEAGTAHLETTLLYEIRHAHSRKTSKRTVRVEVGDQEAQIGRPASQSHHRDVDELCVIGGHSVRK